MFPYRAAAVDPHLRPRKPLSFDMIEDGFADPVSTPLSNPRYRNIAIGVGAATVLMAAAYGYQRTRKQDGNYLTDTDDGLGLSEKRNDENTRRAIALSDIRWLQQTLGPSRMRRLDTEWEGLPNQMGRTSVDGRSIQINANNAYLAYKDKRSLKSLPAADKTAVVKGLEAVLHEGIHSIKRPYGGARVDNPYTEGLRSFEEGLVTQAARDQVIPRIHAAGMDMGWSDRRVAKALTQSYGAEVQNTNQILFETSRVLGMPEESVRRQLLTTDPTDRPEWLIDQAIQHRHLNVSGRQREAAVWRMQGLLENIFSHPVRPIEFQVRYKSILSAMERPWRKDERKPSTLPEDKIAEQIYRTRTGPLRPHALNSSSGLLEEDRGKDDKNVLEEFFGTGDEGAFFRTHYGKTVERLHLAVDLPLRAFFSTAEMFSNIEKLIPNMKPGAQARALRFMETMKPVSGPLSRAAEQAGEFGPSIPTYAAAGVVALHALTQKDPYARNVGLAFAASEVASDVAATHIEHHLGSWIQAASESGHPLISKSADALIGKLVNLGTDTPPAIIARTSLRFGINYAVSRVIRRGFHWAYDAIRRRQLASEEASAKQQNEKARANQLDDLPSVPVRVETTSVVPGTIMGGLPAARTNTNLTVDDKPLKRDDIDEALARRVAHGFAF